jgi:DNA-binding NtrC family response regulator
VASQKSIILAVDDEPNLLVTYRSLLGKQYDVLTASSGQEALEILRTKEIALVLLDMKMPGMSGLELLHRIRQAENEVAVIIITALPEVATAVEAMKLGALDYLAKPFEQDALFLTVASALDRRALRRENLSLKETVKELSSYCDLIGQTPVMRQLYGLIDKVAPTDSTVLIHGESGTGKELVAHAIHQKSRRAEKPFIALNCAAIPENLMESELFGHERGSFTGAQERKLGKFELADGGTFFLDEVGCMSPALQAKFLRVLESKTIERVGGEKSIPVDVRIISATNINFQKEITLGHFRHDLYYRLNVIPVNLIPLRERKEDIHLFVAYFLDKYNKQLNKEVKTVDPAALQILLDYAWPGNVRELQNMIERLVVLANGPVICAEEIPLINPKSATVESVLRQNVMGHERQVIVDALKQTKNNRTKAAKLLGIPRSTLNSRITTLGLD